MRAVKRLFDPDARLNPGKIVDAGPMTDHLRDPALPPLPDCAPAWTSPTPVGCAAPPTGA